MRTTVAHNLAPAAEGAHVVQVCMIEHFYDDFIESLLQ